MAKIIGNTINVENNAIIPGEGESSIVQIQGGSRSLDGVLDPESLVYGINGTALGAGHQIYGDNNIATGRKCKTYQNSSFAFGIGSEAGDKSRQEAFENEINAIKAENEQNQSESTEDYIVRIYSLYNELHKNDPIDNYFSGAAAFGMQTRAKGRCSIASGIGSQAIGEYSEASGGKTQSSGNYAHAEGLQSRAEGNYSHAEGYLSVAKNSGAHAEGHDTIASGLYSHSEGDRSLAVGQTAHAEGYATQALSNFAHAEGHETIALGLYSHSEGNKAEASGQSSHAEGDTTKTLGDYAHAEGSQTQAAWSSHSEGYLTKALGKVSHAEGNKAEAVGDFSHAEGVGTKAYASHQHVQGKYNIVDEVADPSKFGKYAHIVGNGANDYYRSNAHTIDWDGNAWFAGDVTVGKDKKELATKDYVDNKIHSGTEVPSDDFGNDGDIFFLYTE